MRVLFIAGYFPRPNNLAMGPWALSQAQALAQAGLTIKVISPTPWVPRWAGMSPAARRFARCPPSHEWPGVSVEYPRWPFYQVGPIGRMTYANPGPFAALGWAALRPHLRAVARVFAPDVIYAHHTCVSGYVAERLSRELDVPFVVTDHDYDEIVDCDTFAGRRAVYDAVSRRASAVVAVSSRMESEIRARFPAARARTIHNGTHPIAEGILRNPRPAELEDRLVLFSAGMFYERKGFPMLVEAFSRIAARFPTAVLRIAGDGAERHAVEAAIATRGIGDRVTLLGLVSHDRVLQEMAWCDAFSLVGWNEPFATVFIEACSAGVPLVIANDGGFMDVFVDGVHGYSVPPRDVDTAAAALARVLENQDRRVAMGRAARALWSSGLRWEAVAETYTSLFEQALRARRHGG